MLMYDGPKAQMAAVFRLGLPGASLVIVGGNVVGTAWHLKSAGSSFFHSKSPLFPD